MDVCVPMCNLPKSFFISVYIYVRFAISLPNLKILSISINIHNYQVLKINKMKVLRQILNLILKKLIHGKIFNYTEYILSSLNITELKHRFIFKCIGSQSIWNQILSLWLTSCVVIKKLMNHLVSCFSQMSAGSGRGQLITLHVPEAENFIFETTWLFILSPQHKGPSLA